MHQLPPLPYDRDALEPHISKETIDYHYGKHHQAYITKLNELIDGTPHAEQSLEQIIQNSDGPLFNNAAQVWNHSFYWHCLSPQGGGEPSGQLAAAIEHNFGSFAEFKAAFTQAALTQFGSGWAWLVAQEDGQLSILKTANADNPLTHASLTPLLTCDVWEHAYYVDTRNNRAQYIDHFWQCVNWAFVADNLPTV